MTEVFSRSKFDRYLSEETRFAFLTKHIRDAEPVIIYERIQVCRDPKDNMILELAVSGNADYIITGDADLLVLNPFRGISIVTPADFLTLFTRR